MKNLIIVGGTAGVGKTTTCRELQEILPRNVFLDGDWCWDMRPFLVTGETRKMVEGNIAHLLNSFLGCSEFGNVIFCWVLHRQKILDDLIARLNHGDCAVYCFSLVSSEQALSERLSRDIAEGKREPGIIARSIAAIPQYGQFERPAFAPPGAAFPVAWLALNLATATSAWRIWRAPAQAERGPSRGEALAWWAAAVVIRSGYVPLAFGRRLRAATASAALLPAVMARYALLARRIDQPAALLAVPEVAWTGFATVLSATVAAINDH